MSGRVSFLPNQRQSATCPGTNATFNVSANEETFLSTKNERLFPSTERNEGKLQGTSSLLFIHALTYVTYPLHNVLLIQDRLCFLLLILQQKFRKANVIPPETVLRDLNFCPHFLACGSTILYYTILYYTILYYTILVRTPLLSYIYYLVLC